jgi:hypothetical protein
MTDSTVNGGDPAPTAPAEKVRELPSSAEIAQWAKGEDLPTLGALFSELAVARFDVLMLQIRKEELLPQHWQVIGDRTLPDQQVFESYPEIDRLRAASAHSETARGQIEALRIGWPELAGKQPALWTTSDLFVAVRRIIERDLPVDYNELLSATRDVWRGLTLPHGRGQLETLGACLDLIRQKTKK